MNPTVQRIFLVGFMGAGKTTIGKELAKKLKFKFVDLDDLVQSSTKKSISTIFEKEGEIAFRIHEQQALLKLADINNLVIATGGGCATYENNMSWMNEHGYTIYLYAHPGVLFHRLAKNKDGRPLIENLSDLELMKFIDETIEIRHVYYNQALHKENASQTVSEIVSSIISKLKN